MSTFKKIFVSDKYNGLEAGTEVESSSESFAVIGETAFASLEAAIAAAVTNAVILVESGEKAGFYTADAEGSVTAASQVVFVDFNGGSDLSYDNGEYTRSVDMTAANYTKEEIASVIDALNERSAASGIVYTAEKPVSGTYSTVYAGETASFDDLGTFKGLAETIDVGNAIADDEAFVNTANITSLDELVEVISHEVGHLMGESHEVTTGTLRDYMETKGHVDVTSENSPYNLGTGDTYTAMAGDGGALKVNSGCMAYGTNLTFTSCTATTWSGGAIRNEGTVVLSGISIFTNNTSATAAAIWNNSGASFTMGGGTFSGNYATHSQGSGGIQNFGTFTATGDLYFSGNTGTGGCGSAIWNESYANFTMAGGTFTDNVGTVIHSDTDSNDSTKFTATGDLYFLNNQGLAFILMSGTGTMQNATFIGNTGGAICNQGLFTMKNGVFTNNISGGTVGGGAINNSGIFTATDVLTFTGNSAAANGGAVYNAGTFSMAGGEFVSNTGSVGGAVYNAGTFTAFQDLLFAGNTAASNGGAIYNTGTFSMAGGTFTNNVLGASANLGGAIFNYNGSVTASDTLYFSGNTANGTGAVRNAGIFTMAGGTFSGNRATGSNTGALSNDAAGTFSASGALTFSANTAATLGGAIVNEGAFTMAAGTFTGNVAGTDGGAIWNKGTNAVFTASDTLYFSSNTAASNGGAVYNGGTVTMAGGTFSGNAATHAGAIYNSGMVTAANTLVFADNIATTNDGGAIWNNNGTFSMAGGTFSGNSAVTGGGAINNAGTFTATGDLTFAGNSGSYGGAIHSSKTLNLAGVTFTGNSAGQGAAIDNHTGASATISGTAVFADNVVTGYAGAINNNAASSTFSMAGGTFSGNTAANVGGAIRNAGTFTATNELLFTGNSAGEGGGAISNTGIFSMAGGTFSGNISGSNGGALLHTGGTFSMTGPVVFADNYAESAGGGAIRSDAFISAADTLIFTGNTAESSDGNGGAICSGGVFSMAGGTFANNVAIGTAGGGAIQTGNTFTATDTLFFTDNVAVNADGGAIWNDYTITMAGGTFTGNTAAGKGGAIYIKKGTVTATGDIEFSGNTAATGGAVYNAGTFNFSRNLTLATDSDTLINASGATLNWNIAGGTAAHAQLQGYKYLTNSGTLAITVAAESGAQQLGTYVIATEAVNSEAGTAFTLTGGTGTATITVGGAAVSYNGGKYILSQNTTDQTLVLNAVGTVTSRTVVTTAMGPDAEHAYDLGFGTFYTAPAYSGNGGAIEVQSDAFASGINLTLTGNTATTWGGALYNAGSLTMAGGNFSANKGGSGGAFFNDAVFTATDDLTFSSNTATEMGGAFFNAENATFTMTGGTFTGNVATGGSGGGAFRNHGTLTATGDLVFENNSATASSGGAILARGSISMQGGTFTGNKASASGGAILQESGVITAADDLIFSGNSAATWGGAISAAGTISMAGGTFSGNTAKNGGAIYTETSSVFNATDTLVFAGNKVSGLGGAIYNRGNFNMAGGTFSGNTSIYGGAIYNLSGEFTMTGVSVFANNIVNGYYSGGAIRNAAAFTATNTLIFTGNSTTDSDSGNGGAISNGGIFTMAGGTFSGNYAAGSKGGGAIYNETSGVFNATDTLVFAGNTAIGAGSAVYNTGTFTMAGGTFSGNLIGGTGAVYSGAVYNGSGKVFTATDTVYFTGNTTAGSSQSRGGAIANEGTMNLAGGTFSGNTAVISSYAYGGAILNVTGATLTIGDAVFTDNVVSGNSNSLGGAIYNDGTINATGTLYFSGNTDTKYGSTGAVHNRYGTFNFSKTLTLATASDTFANNSTLNWDLTSDSATYAQFVGYDKLSNSGTLAITVNADQATGDYVIATGVEDTLDASKKTFSLRSGSDTTGISITVGGGDVFYMGRVYALTQDTAADTLTLTAKSSGTISNRIVVTTAMGPSETEAFNLTTGSTITAPVYGGWGGAVEVQADAFAEGKDLLFTGNSISMSGSNAGGGALVNYGSLTLTGATFTDNRTTGSSYTYGGAVFNAGTLELAGGVFTGNYSSLFGGALYNQTALNATGDLYFAGNTAGNRGGAINMQGTFNMEGGTFANNVAGGVTWAGGGAILVENEAAVFTATGDLYFTGNTSGNMGGAIHNGGTFTMAGGTFENNISGGTAGGGAIYSNNTFTATDTLTFTGNSAAADGGAIWNYATFTMADGTFTGNTARDGGAIYNYTGAVFSMAGGTFTGNYGTNTGGAIRNNGTFTAADELLFSGNSTGINGGAVNNTGTFTAADMSFTGNAAAAGGAVINLSNFSMSDGIFTGNTATGDGGAVYNTGTFTMADGIFTGNTAAGTADAVYNTGTFTMAGGTFSGNKAGNVSGAIYNTGTFTANGDTLFSGNTTTGGSGSAAIYTAGAVNLNGISIFADNVVTGAEGAAIGLSSSGTVTMAGGTFANNRAAWFGGAICNRAGVFTATGDLTFANNTAGNHGGAVNNQGTFTMTGGTFANNGSSGSGGAFRNITTFTASGDLLFTGNTAAGIGAAVYNQGTFTMAGGTFSGNTAGVDGGALYNTSVFSMTGGTFANNVAGGTGGAIYNAGTFSATDTLYFTGNTVTNTCSGFSQGGAVYNAGTFTMTGGTFTGNTVANAGNGSAIRNDGAFTATDNLLFTGNKSANIGAIINSASFTMAGGTFANNVAETGGGAIWNDGNGTFTATGGLLFTGNTALDSYGGAICNSGTISMAGGTFTGNSATWAGAAILNWGVFTATDDLYFSGNTATPAEEGVDGQGGAIYNTSTFTMTGGTFANNFAGDGDGGAIYNSGTLTATDDLYFSGNTAANGGAVYNKGTFNFGKTITLDTASDTFVNGSNATLNWNISGGTENHSLLAGFDRLTNEGTLSITVASDIRNQQCGNYVIATGASNDATGTAFTLTGASGTAAITVGGGSVSYNGGTYTLTQNTEDDTLVLNVAGKISTRIVVTTEMGPSAENPYNLGDGLTYTCAYTGQNGGAVCVNNNAFAEGSNLIFTGNKAEWNGGAIVTGPGSVLTLTNVTFTSNTCTKDNGGAMVIDGTVNLSGYNLFDSNWAYCNQGGGAIKVNGGALNITGGTTVFRHNLQARYDSAYGGGAVAINTLFNADGDVIFDGNTSNTYAKAGAVIVNGTFKFSKNVTLVTSTDTLWNKVFLNWNITGGTEDHGILNGFDKVTNDGTFVITVDGANQEEGDYVIATGVEDTLAASKQTFSIRTGADTTGVSVTVDGGAVNYNGKSYTLAHDTEADTLTLTVAAAVSPVTTRLCVTTTMGPDAENAYNLGDNITYTAPVWSSNGGVLQTETNAYAEGGNLTFTGNTSDYGGAIYNGGNLSLDGATVTGNSASYTGGAVSVQGGTVSFNGAVTASSNAAQHGGFAENKSVLDFNDTALITGNSVTKYGGAIFNHGTGTVTLTGATFADNIASNTASVYGGAIYNAGTVTATEDLLFTGNVAQTLGGGYIYSTGGAVYNEGTFTMEGGTFADNISTHNDAGAVYNGGTGTFIINDDVVFANNFTNALGGAIENNGTAVMTINGDALFTGNTSADGTYGRGAGIYNTATLNLNGNAVFTGNTATVRGGAIENNGGTVNFAKNLTLSTSTDTIYNKGTLNWNIAGGTASYAQLQGYQYLTNDTGTLSITVAAAAGAQQSGDYVLATGVDSVSGKNSFTLKGGSNTATITVGGGKVSYNGREYTLTQNTTDQTLVLNVANKVTSRIVVTTEMGPSEAEAYNLGSGVTFTAPVYSGNGGALEVQENAFASGSNLTFTGNSATSAGAAMVVNGTVNFTENSVFSGNTASGFGGAIENNGTVNLGGGTFCNNTAAAHDGGAICTANAFTIDGNAVFTGNSAYYLGGAIRNVGTVGTSYFAITGDALFSNNGTIVTGGTLHGQGGAIDNRTSFAIGGNAVFTGNRARQGAAVFNEGTFSMAGGTFSANTATDCGAAVFNTGSFTASEDLLFADNNSTAGYGAAIFNNAGTVNLAGGTFTGNRAVGGEGGAIYNYSGSVTASGDLYFSSNWTARDGGAIINNGTFSMAGGTFTGNSAGCTAGAISNVGDSGSTLTINGTSLFANNVTATSGNYGQGGAIYNNGATNTVTLNGDAVFIGNIAQHGGAVNNNGTFSMAGGTFSGNTASFFGGAIHTSGTMSFADDVFFSGNTAQYGGAIRNEGTITFGKKAEFVSNTASLSGGAIYVAGAASTVTFDDEVSFSGNTAGKWGGAINNEGTVIFNKAVSFSNNVAVGTEASINGGAYCSGTSAVVTFNDDATFSGNSAGGSATVGGAILNQGILNFAGNLKLSTSTDTLYNTGTMNWDLTGGLSKHAKLTNYQYLTNSGTLNLVVDAADQQAGKYVIATGDFTSLTGKDTFHLKSGSTEMAVLTVNGDYYVDSTTQRMYSVTTDDTNASMYLTIEGIVRMTHQGTTISCDSLEQAGLSALKSDEITILGNYTTVTGEDAYIGSNVTLNTQGHKVTVRSLTNLTVAGDGLLDGAAFVNMGTLNVGYNADGAAVKITSFNNYGTIAVNMTGADTTQDYTLIRDTDGGTNDYGTVSVTGHGWHTKQENGDLIAYYVRPAAMIGDVEYTSLADAIAAVENGQTITLLNDATGEYIESTVFDTGKNYSIDLNGYNYVTTGDVSDAITFRESNMTFTAVNVSTGTMTVNGKTRVESTGEFTNSGTLNIALTALVAADTWSGAEGTINVTGSGELADNFYKIVDQNDTTLAIGAYGTLQYNGGEVPSGYAFAVEDGDLILKKTDAEAADKSGDTDIVIKNDEVASTYFGGSVINEDYKISVLADAKAEEMKVTGDVSATKTTVTNAGETVTLTRDVISTAADETTLITTMGTSEHSKVKVGGGVIGDNVTIGNTKGSGDSTVEIVNGITAVDKVTISNIGGGAMSVASNVYVKGGLLEIRNETAEKLDASGKLEVADINIYNNEATTTNLGNIEITDQIEAEGNISITNASTVAEKGEGTAKKGIVNLGTATHTAGGDLTISNTSENTINGSGTAAEETAAQFAVAGNATIENAGHLNASVVAEGDITISNTSVNTLIGDYTGESVTVENVGGAAHDVELTATNGNIDITNSVSAEEGSGQIVNLTANAVYGSVSIHGGGTTTNAVINTNALYMGGSTVEITGGSVLDEDANIYLQYASEDDFFDDTTSTGAVLTITGDLTVASNINGTDFDESHYGTLKMNGDQTYTGFISAATVSVEAGKTVTVDTDLFDFDTLAIAGNLTIDFTQQDAFTGAGAVTGAGSLQTATYGEWIVNDTVVRDFSGFSGSVSMKQSGASITMGLGDGEPETSYFADGVTMTAAAGQSINLKAADITTGIVFTGAGTLNVFEDQTLTADNTIALAQVTEGKTLTLQGDFDGSITLDKDENTEATTLALNYFGITVGGTITGDNDDLVNVIESATLSAESALNAFTGTVTVGDAELTLGNTNTTSALFTGGTDAVINAEAKQVLTATGALNSFSGGTVELNSNEIELDGVNETSAKFNGTVDAKINADATQTLSADGALDGFEGTVELEDQTIVLGGTNSTGALFTGSTTSVIDANANQTLTATGALNDFNGTVELDGNEIELDGANETAAKFTGTVDSKINADAKQTLTLAGALNDFNGTVELDDNEIELDAANTTAAKFTGTVDSKINADAKQTLTLEGALNDFNGTVELESSEIELDAANTTAAKFTGTVDSKINADAKQTLTQEGALNDFNGTVELESSEIELDAANETAALFTGNTSAKINADATQTLSAAGALNGFSGTVELEGNEIELDAVNKTAAKFTGTVDSTINADAKQTLTLEGALNDFNGTVELESSEIELDAANTTAAKFTGTVDAKINADAKQTLTLEGALDEFEGTVELEGNEIELDAANTTAALFTGNTSAKINADATQTLSAAGALNGFNGTVELEDQTIILSGTNSTAAKFTSGTSAKITANDSQTLSGDNSGFTGTAELAEGKNLTLQGDFGGNITLDKDEDTAVTTLTLDKSGITVGGTITGDSGTTGDVIDTLQSATLSATGALNNFKGTIKVTDAATTLTLGGVNTTSAVFVGAGTVSASADQTFTGDNSGFAGKAYVTEGKTLTLEGDFGGAIDLGTTVVPNVTTLVLNKSGITVSGAITGDSDDLISMVESATLNGDNSGFAGTLTVTEGQTLTLESNFGGNVTLGVDEVPNVTTLKLNAADIIVDGTVTGDTDDVIDVVENATLSAESALNSFAGEVKLGDGTSASILTLSGANSTAAKFTGGTGTTVNADAKQTLTLSGALNEFNGTIELEGNEIELDAENTTAAKFTGNTSSKINADATQTLSLAGALNDFNGTVELEEQTIVLGGTNSTAAKFTGETTSKIDADENQTLSADGALDGFKGTVELDTQTIVLGGTNSTAAKFTGETTSKIDADKNQALSADGALDGFKGTVELDAQTIVLGGTNSTAAKFTGSTAAVIDADAKQVLTAEGALNGFSGTVALEGSEIELDAENTTAAKFTGNTSSKINADATQTLSADGALDGFEGTVELEDQKIVLGGTNSTAAKFTGSTTSVIDADKNQTLTVAGALNGFAGTVELEANELELDGINTTAALFKGGASSKLNADAKQVLTAAGALNNFGGTVELEANEIELDAENNTAALFTGDTASKINADAKQVLTATGALNNFGGTVELEGNEIELDAENNTAAKFTGDTASTLNADAKQILSAAGALDGFNGTVALEGNEIELDGANETAAKFTGDTVSKINADATQTLSAAGALDGFNGTVELEDQTIVLGGTNSTAAMFTGSTAAVIDADAKQVLTAEGALNGFSGTVALEGNEIELDAENTTAAKFTGDLESKINVDATQTLSADGALDGFGGVVELEDETIVLGGTNSSYARFTGGTGAVIDANAMLNLRWKKALNGFAGTVALEGNEIVLGGTNSTAAKFTGNTSAKINVDATQTLSLDGALNDFNGTVELDAQTIVLGGTNSTAAKFTGGTAAVIDANAKQTLSLAGALNDFEGTVALEGNELELTGANTTSAAITGTDLITAKADQTFSGDISGFSGTIDANGSSVVTLSGKVADTLNLRGNEVILTDAVTHTASGPITVNADTALTTLTANDNNVKLVTGTFTNVTSTSGNIDLTEYAGNATAFTTLTTTDGTICLTSATPITVSGTVSGDLDYTVTAATTEAGLTYTGTPALEYTDDITLTAADGTYFDGDGYKLIDTEDNLTLASDYSITVNIGSYAATTLKINDGATKIGDLLYRLVYANGDLVLKTGASSTDMVYVNEHFTGEYGSDVMDTYYNPEKTVKRTKGFDAMESIDEAVEFMKSKTEGKGTIELTEDKTYAVSSILGTDDNEVTNMTLQSRADNPTTTANATIKGEIVAGKATTLNLSNVSAKGSIFGAGILNITGTSLSRYSGKVISAGGVLNVTGGVYTSLYLVGGSYNGASGVDTSITITGTSERVRISGSVYGGNLADGSEISFAQTKKSSVLIDVTDTKKVYIAGNIYAGGASKAGATLSISGDRAVTITGTGANLSFTGRVSGAAQNGITDGGSAVLNFTDYAGKFSGSISDFNGIVLSGTTSLSLGRRQTLVSGTAMTFSIADTASSSAMYTVRDKNSWEFAKDITVSASATAASGNYTLVDNYKAGFSGFAFTVAGHASAAIGTEYTDAVGNKYTLSYADNKLTLAYTAVDHVSVNDVFAAGVNDAASKITGITALDTDVAGIKRLGTVADSNLSAFAIDGLDITVGDALQIAGADTLDDLSDDLWAKLAYDADDTDSLLVSWGRSADEITTALNAFSNSTDADKAVAGFTLSATASALDDGLAESDFLKKDNGKLA